MKKSFMFVAVAAAGMLASCSSESLTGSDPKIEPTQEELVPIEINVATPMARSGMTRGTGTVGAVEDGSGNAVNNDGSAGGASNVWKGQSVRVYMFDKGTLNATKFLDNGVSTSIYENALLETPTDVVSGVAKYPNGSGRYYVRHYPLSGAYDFWGYRIDDATTTADPAVSGDGNKLSVEITVNGSQDILGAKTVATPYDDLTPAQKTAFGDEATYLSKLYSASAARQSVQPKLVFNHLMTRLTFQAYAGNNNAKKVIDPSTPGDPSDDVYAGVYVAGIKVRAIKNIDTSVTPADTTYYTNVGTFEIAAKPELTTFKPNITWGEVVADYPSTLAPSQFVLMKRNTSVAVPEAANLIDLVNTSDNDPATNGSVSLVNTATDGSAKEDIGEALIVPDAQAYELEILLVQKARKFTDSDPADPADWTDYNFSYITKVVRTATPPAVPDPFKVGYSYNFVIKAYGLEEIEITTQLQPWVFGENVGVETE